MLDTIKNNIENSQKYRKLRKFVRESNYIQKSKNKLTTPFTLINNATENTMGINNLNSQSINRSIGVISPKTEYNLNKKNYLKNLEKDSGSDYREYINKGKQNKKLHNYIVPTRIISPLLTAAACQIKVAEIKVYNISMEKSKK